MTKNNVEKYKSKIGDPNLSINFYGFCVKENVFHCYQSSSPTFISGHVGNESPTTVLSNMVSSEDEKLKEFYNKYECLQVDLLFFETAKGQGHFALFSAPEFFKSKRKYCNKPFLFCRICGDSMVLLRSFILHLFLCEMNQKTTYPFVRYPTRKNVNQPPVANLTRIPGEERLVYGCLFDCETKFNRINETKHELVPGMAYATGFCNVPVGPFDSPEIARLKTEPFPSTLQTGSDCIEKMLREIFEIGRLAKIRIEKLKTIYNKYLLTEQQKAFFKTIKACETCGVEFQNTGKFQANVDHSRLFGAPLTAGRKQTGLVLGLICKMCNLARRLNSGSQLFV